MVLYLGVDWAITIRSHATGYQNNPCSDGRKLELYDILIDHLIDRQGSYHLLLQV